MDEYDRKIKKRIPPSGSLEGITMYMNWDHPDGTAFGSMLKDECSLMFEQLKKTYSSDFMETFSLMYDGHIEGKVTRSYKLEEVENCHVSFFGASTKTFYRKMPIDYFDQGIGNRPFYCLWNGKTPKFDNPEEAFRSRQAWTNRVYDIIKKLRECEKFTEAGIAHEAMELWWEYHEEEMKEAEKLYHSSEPLTDYYSSYRGGNPERVLKVAMLRSVGDNYKKDLDTIIIEKEHIEYAIKVVNEYYEEYKQMVRDWIKVSQEKVEPIENIQPAESNVLSAIERNADSFGWSKRGDVMRVVGGTAKNFDNIIETLKEKEFIVECDDSYFGQTKPGPKTTYYKCL